MANDIQVDTSELVALRARIARMVSKFPQAADNALERWSKWVRKELKSQPYPPPPRGSKYRRTGNLANRYYSQRVAFGRFSIGNRATYSRFVVGDNEGKGQAKIHQNRWYKFRTQLEKRLKYLYEWMKEAIVHEQ